MILSATFSLMKWYFNTMCLVLPIIPFIICQEYGAMIPIVMRMHVETQNLRLTNQVIQVERRERLCSSVMCLRSRTKRYLFTIPLLGLGLHVTSYLWHSFSQALKKVLVQLPKYLGLKT